MEKEKEIYYYLARHTSPYTNIYATFVNECLDVTSHSVLNLEFESGGLISPQVHTEPNHLS